MFVPVPHHDASAGRIGRCVGQRLDRWSRFWGDVGTAARCATAANLSAICCRDSSVLSGLSQWEVVSGGVFVAQHHPPPLRSFRAAWLLTSVALRRRRARNNHDRRSRRAPCHGDVRSSCDWWRRRARRLSGGGVRAWRRQLHVGVGLPFNVGVDGGRSKTGASSQRPDSSPPVVKKYNGNIIT